MRYLKSLFVAALLLAGCSNVKEEPVKVLSPTGAPSLSLIESINEESENKFEFVTGSEVLGSELVKDSEYDIIIAPVNLGAKMIQAGKSEYRLKAVITWGNLYVVGTSENALQEEGTFATFGEGSVVDFVLKQAVNLDELTPNVEYYSSAQDVQGALLSGKANCGMLAEPAVTATIKKAKEQNIELKVLQNLQTSYKEKVNASIEGFPQAAIFVKQGSESKVEDLLSKIEKFVNETAVNDPAQIETLVDKIGADKLGVPSAALSKATWAKQNIKFVEAKDCQDDLKTLLSLMNIEFTEDMLSK